MKNTLLNHTKERNENNVGKGKNIAVIGAGIIGVNCAVELQSLGFSVTLLDKENVGEGCSKGNAGHFATEQVFPLAEFSLLWQLPKLLLDPLGPMALSPSYFPRALPWFFKFISNMTKTKRVKNGEAIKSLNNKAIEYYKPVLKAANAEHLLTTKGSLLVFESTPFTQVKKQYQHYHSAGVAVELLNREQVLKLEPNLSESIQHALFFTEVGHTLAPHEICVLLADHAKNLGAEIKQFSVKDIINTDKNDTVKITDGKTVLSFDHVVIATGAWSEKLLNQLSYKLPIEAERGYSLNLANVKVNDELSRPVASAERKFIMTPMAHGLRLSGTVEFAGLKIKANMKRAEMLYQHAKNMLIKLPSFTANSNINEQIDKNTEQKWLGFRPSLPDSLPVIGQAPNHENIYFALGHQHLGLTQGAITGKLIGQIVTKHPTDIDISPFCISRFN